MHMQLPFLVIATQNPAEYHGTFPLPESQLDRFLMRLCLGYPTLTEERKVLNRAYSLHPAEMLDPVLSAQEVLALQARVDQVHMEESLTDYLLAIVQATRQSELLSLGVSTRGALGLSKLYCQLEPPAVPSNAFGGVSKSWMPWPVAHVMVTEP